MRIDKLVNSRKVYLNYKLQIDIITLGSCTLGLLVTTTSWQINTLKKIVLILKLLVIFNWEI